MLVASSNWPHVRVVNKPATTSSQHRDSDGPLCAACSVTLTEPHNEAVEQGFPHIQTSAEQRFPIHNEAVGQGFPHTNTSVEQRLPINVEAVEQGAGGGVGLPEERAAALGGAFASRGGCFVLFCCESLADGVVAAVFAVALGRSIENSLNITRNRVPVAFYLSATTLLHSPPLNPSEIPLAIVENHDSSRPHDTKTRNQPDPKRSSRVPRAVGRNGPGLESTHEGEAHIAADPTRSRAAVVDEQ